MHNWLILGGGITAGTGIIFMLFGFEADTGKDFAESFSQIGYTGLTSFSANSSGMIGLGLLVLGVILLVAANRSVWTKTDGY